MSSKTIVSTTPRPFANVLTWRDTERGRAIEKFDRGVCLSEPQPKRRRRAVGAEIYRVESYVSLASPEARVLVHYVPGVRLGQFVRATAQHVEIITDVRPITVAQAFVEIRAFQGVQEVE